MIEYVFSISPASVLSMFITANVDVGGIEIIRSAISFHWEKRGYLRLTTFESCVHTPRL